MNPARVQLPQISRSRGPRFPRTNDPAENREILRRIVDTEIERTGDPHAFPEGAVRRQFGHGLLRWADPVADSLPDEDRWGHRLAATAEESSAIPGPNYYQFVPEFVDDRGFEYATARGERTDSILEEAGGAEHLSMWWVKRPKRLNIGVTGDEDFHEFPEEASRVSFRSIGARLRRRRSTPRSVRTDPGVTVRGTVVQSFVGNAMDPGARQRATGYIVLAGTTRT